MPSAPDTPDNYEYLMQANLSRVFGERDAGRRMTAIREIYAEDAVLYEPGTSAAGHEAIGQAVGQLLSNLPPSLVFTAIGRAVGHHGVGRLRWKSGLPDGPVAVTGTDVAHIVDDRIQSLHVFIDPSDT